MVMLVQPTPLEEAVRKLGAKTPVASALRSKDWAGMPLALRERAQFSAGVEDARLMDLVQTKLMSAISLRREQVANGAAYVDRSSFIGDFRKYVDALGLSDQTGGLTDLATRARAALIYDTQIESAFGFAHWKRGTDPDVLNGTPAQELIASTARQPRIDWGERWSAACDESGDDKAQAVYDETGRLVALKTSAVWTALNEDFGVPWPPFAFGSKRLLRDVFREEAEALGLLDPEDVLDPVQAQRLNDDLQADVTPGMAEILDTIFGDQIQVVDGKAMWRGAAA